MILHKYKVGDKVTIVPTKLRELKRDKGKTGTIREMRSMGSPTTGYCGRAYWFVEDIEACWEEELQPASLKTIMGGKI